MLSWSRFCSPSSFTCSEPLSILKRINALGVFVQKKDLPELEWLMVRLCELSNSADERSRILHQLWKSLNSCSDWRCVYIGLRVLRGLAMSGSPDIFCEISGGLHFDIFQRTLILTTYSNEDERVSQLIQTLAKSVRNLLVERCSDFGADDVDEQRSPAVHTPDISQASDLIDL